MVIYDVYVKTAYFAALRSYFDITTKTRKINVLHKRLKRGFHAPNENSSSTLKLTTKIVFVQQNL